MRTAIFLLPPRARLPGALPDAVARALGRADVLAAGEAGERAQLLRHFDLLPRGWPVAALTRQRDAGDVLAHGWLRADPVYARPDINGVRLLAHGEAMQLTSADAEALLPALRPLFGDAGFPIDAPVPSRWYLRLPRETRLPTFAEPSEALGADLFEHLPEGPEGRRWRALLSEAQVILHNHPHNAIRMAAGRPPVNSLWFWGGGVLPDHVRTVYAAVHGEEALLAALAQAAGCAPAPLPPRFAPRDGALLYDLRVTRDAGALAEAWLVPAVEALRRGTLGTLTLDFEDGARFRLVRGQRWRVWRRPMAAFA